MQIKNPKVFMSSRNKGVDKYTSRGTIRGKAGVRRTSTDTEADRMSRQRTSYGMSRRSSDDRDSVHGHSYRKQSSRRWYSRVLRQDEKTA